MTSTNVVAARLTDGRLLIAILDPHVPDHRSPLRYHLRNEAPRGRKGPKGPGSASTVTPAVQVTDARKEPGEGQPGQTPIRTPR